MHPSKESVNYSCPTPLELVDNIAQISREPGFLYKFGSFSEAIYDTAWVSLVYKQENGWVDWLFPECYEYILRTQQHDGTWPTYSSQIDGILNSLAGLLSLLVHRTLDPDLAIPGLGIETRIARAWAGIKALLTSWDVSNTDHVAFEILVPALLRRIEEFNLFFDFEGKKMLEKFSVLKSRTPDQIMAVLSRKPSALHSAEAFHGLVDFNVFRSYCSDELGVMSSPAATAAYLMYSSPWDSRAETYLRKVVSAHLPKGGIPNAYPTSIFELSWILSLMFSPTLALKSLEGHDRSKLGGVILNLEETLHRQSGTIGFAPGVVADADDTARLLILLGRLEKHCDPDPMIRKFRSHPNHPFRTYEAEKNPSFSANCNILLSLLESPNYQSYGMEIENIMKFLIACYKSGAPKDKWNVSPTYSTMLFSEAIVTFLKRYDYSPFNIGSKDILLRKLFITISRILTVMLKDQDLAGSWSGSVEVTAYSVLSIGHLMLLPWSQTQKLILLASLKKGQEFVSREFANLEQNARLWIEKTSYQPKLIRTAYCSAALHISSTSNVLLPRLENYFNTSSKEIKIQKLLSSLPLLLKNSSLMWELIILESSSLSARLRSNRCMVFPRDTLPMTEDKYLDFIPLIWVSCNHLAANMLPEDILYNMIVLSMLNYQVDEYMESVISPLDHVELSNLRKHIRATCLDVSCATNICGEDTQSANTIRHQEDIITEENSVSNIMLTVTAYIRYVLQHPAVSNAPLLEQKQLAAQLRDFLLAHIDHNAKAFTGREDNVSFDRETTSDQTEHSDYFTWVRGIASDDTSCPFSFQFFACLISLPGTSCFEGPRASYISKSLARHLATMCRQYNDYGSMQRDSEEGTLNSLDFPEFSIDRSDGACGGINDNDQTRIPDDTVLGHHQDKQQRSPQSDAEYKKAELFALAQYERECMQLSLATLKPLVSEATIGAVEIFVNVTDLFGQIYVQQDIASRLQPRRQST